MQRLLTCALVCAIAAPVRAATPDVDPGLEQRLAELFEARRFARASKLAETVLGDPEMQSAHDTARLVRAFAQLRMGALGGTRDALEAVATHGPDLGNYLAHLQSALAVKARGCDAASQDAERIELSSVFWLLAWSRVTSCWILSGDHERAAQSIRRIEHGAPGARGREHVLLLRARMADAQRAPVEARNLYRRLLVEAPLSPVARQAGKRLAQLEAAGVRTPPLSADELLPRAEQERKRFKASRARRTYRRVLSKAHPERAPSAWADAQLGLVELDIVEQRYPRALRRIERVVEKITSSAAMARAHYLRGDILARRGRVTPSLEAYRAAMDAAPDHAYAHEAALSAAQIAYNVRAMDDARAFATWLLGRSPVTESLRVVGTDGLFELADASRGARDNALWILAWVARRSGDPIEVSESYLAQIEAEGALGQASAYWRARFAEERGDGESMRVFALVAKEQHPLSYYGLAASALLGRHASDRANADASTNESIEQLERVLNELALSDWGEGRDTLAAVVLSERGMVSEATRVLRQIPMGSLETTDLVAAAMFYTLRGEIHRGAIITRRRAATATSLLQHEPLLRAAYPIAYQDIVEPIAEQYELPSALIYAVIRQESAFNPRAISPRKARGLMQMIRPTAIRTARQASLRRFKLRQLFEPEMSIRLGAHYLATLRALFPTNVAASVAAYHAGERSVQRWLATRSDMPIDEFIEDIPYTGTRAYVRKVLSALAIYSLLYGNDNGTVLEGLSARPSMSGRAYADSKKP